MLLRRSLQRVIYPFCKHVKYKKSGKFLQHLRFIHKNESELQIPQINIASKAKQFSATVSPNKDLITLHLDDGSQLKYPSLWLRDNCQCSKCYNPHMYSRIIHWQHFDINVMPTNVTVDSNGVQIDWSDSHQSYYTNTWLWERRFEKDNQQHWLNTMYRPKRIPWGAAEFPSILKKFSFHSIMENDSELLAWLHNLVTYGVNVVTDTPHGEDQLKNLVNRVSFGKRTHYGEQFEVKHKPDTTNTAYQNSPLQMHTDLPYYEYKPLLNLLHCLVQSSDEGGANMLTDVLNVSNQLRKHDPETYKILSTTVVDWNDIGEEDGLEFHSLYRAPVLCEDRTGEFVRVNYSQAQRDSRFNVALDDVLPWYRAYAVFTKYLYHPDNFITIKTNPGEILAFDNIRVTHARTGYEYRPDNDRHLIGIYMDGDIVYSRIRVLMKKFQDKPEDTC